MHKQALSTAGLRTARHHEGVGCAQHTLRGALWRPGDVLANSQAVLAVLGLAAVASSALVSSKSICAPCDLFVRLCNGFGGAGHATGCARHGLGAVGYHSLQELHLQDALGRRGVNHRCV
jgi:hypothetical protein